LGFEYPDPRIRTLTKLKRLKAFQIAIESQGGFKAQGAITPSNEAIRKVGLAVLIIFERGFDGRFIFEPEATR